MAEINIVRALNLTDEQCESAAEFASEILTLEDESKLKELLDGCMCLQGKYVLWLSAWYAGCTYGSRRLLSRQLEELLEKCRD